MVEGITTLSEQQLEDQFNHIVHFLSAIHPSLLSGSGFRPCVELRPILRAEVKGKGNSTYFLKKSLQIWDLEPRSLDRLREFLKRHNGQPTCLYYSVFNYDNNAESVTVKGEKSKSGKITSATARSTQEIALDFDHIGFDDYVDLVDRFESIGIYAIWVFSGHGYQAHILLDQCMTEKRALRQMVYKFRSKGFDCDAACTDPARVMRLPFTFNLKCLKDETYADERENPPICSVVQETEERYSLEDIFTKLDELPTVSDIDDAAYRNALSSSPAATEDEAQTDLGFVPDDEELVRVTRVEYPYLSEFEMPDAIHKMLTETPQGYRNKVLGFLIKYFKTQYKLGKQPILEILTIWAENACVPPYDSNEFKTDFTRLYYQYNGLGYDPSLARQFGVIDFDQLTRLRKQDIFIPNKFFRSFDKLDAKAVRLYLAIKMLEHYEEDATQEKLAETLGISTRALRPTLQDLIKSGHAFLSKGNARMQIPNTYHTSRIVSTHDGYMSFSYNDIYAYVNDLYGNGSRGNGELKLYLFMRYKYYSGEIYVSQANLGKNIGVAQTTISELVSRLEERKFLRVRKVYRSNGLQSCEYDLLR